MAVRQQADMRRSPSWTTFRTETLQCADTRRIILRFTWDASRDRTVRMDTENGSSAGHAPLCVSNRTIGDHATLMGQPLTAVPFIPY